MLSRLFERVLLAFAALAVAVLVFVMASVDYEVFMRYFLGRPTTWVVDFSEYALLYLLFLAAPWVLLRDAHIKIDILLYFCPPRVQRVLNFVASLLGAAVCAVFCYFSATVVWATFQSSELLWRSIIVSKWAVWIVMPVGSFLLTVQFLRRALAWYRGEATSAGPSLH